MSHSTLYGITKDFHGVEISEYHNSFLFGPAIWRFLELKYHTSSVSGFTFTEGEKQINAIMNKGENFAEQICWELSNQQVFSIADKDLVADCIDKFIEVAQFVGNYDVDRFHTVAADIRNMDKHKYKFFVFKNTDVDDEVANWFYTCGEEPTKCSMLDSDYFKNELVVIDPINHHVHRFMPFDEFKSTYEQYK